MKKKAAIILAAGQGTRMKSKIQKQFLMLKGRPLLCHALSAFEHSSVDDIIVVTGEDSLTYVKEEIIERYAFLKVRALVAGGKERYHSVYAGLKALETLGYGEEDMVLIQDGARPMVDAEMIERSIEGVARYQACVCAMPSKDTIKVADEDGFALTTPDRSKLWMIQTPQSFSYPLVLEAYRGMMEDERLQVGVTDDAMVVEMMTPVKVKLIEGSYRNIKVTTPEDLLIAEVFLQSNLQ